MPLIKHGVIQTVDMFHLTIRPIVKVHVEATVKEFGVQVEEVKPRLIEESCQTDMIPELVKAQTEEKGDRRETITSALRSTRARRIN